ncbi:MAG TPA: di-heme oxidoredictase family protein [Longimicrobiales bacterium]|nr:di-heme oxidoredictase family protein [Longimicrobiales bacterium]
MRPPTRLRAAIASLAWVLGGVPGCTEPPPPPAPGEPLAGLSDGELGRFLLGKAVFERLATAEEGLGPLFNAPRCSACHEVPASGGSGDVLVRKATRFADGRCDLLVAEGGDNFQLRATELLLAHGVGPETVPASATGEALVTSPTLFGLGLVEAIPEEALLALADPDDRDGDGVSGRSGTTADGRVGRFGRKAETRTIRDFVDGALRFELGFTTPDHPVEESVNGAPLPEGADPMPEPEIDARGVDLLTDYVRFLAPETRAVPGTRAARDSVERGEELFSETGCAACHLPVLRTGPSDVAALSHRDVPLYSDLLLHDLGSDLADLCGPGATSSEHRTARLWGLRTRSRFLHDGRAASVEDAIRLHGGEAEGSRLGFEALDAAERALLLRFLSTL